MKRTLMIMLLILFAGPQDLFADRTHYRTHYRIGIRPHAQPHSQDRQNRCKQPAQRVSQNRHSRFKLPARRLVRPGKPVHPSYPGYKPGRPGHGHPGYWRPAISTVVRETPPVIIVYQSPTVAPAPPEPQEVWVPPVMDTRTEPGYWDYGIKKEWMDDHWRYEQDHEKPIWVPAAQVSYVKQEGYWQPVE